MGNVGDHERALLRNYVKTSMGDREKDQGVNCTCIITRLSAFPVRMSYKVNVRSEPILASTEDSDRLKRRAEIVSVEVGKVRFDMAALL